MSVKVVLPTPLRPYAGNSSSVEVEGKTLGEVLKGLFRVHQELKKHMTNDDGTIRNFVNIYVNNEDVRYGKNDATPLKDGDIVTIVPSIAGGR